MKKINVRPRSKMTAVCLLTASLTAAPLSAAFGMTTASAAALNLPFGLTGSAAAQSSPVQPASLRASLVQASSEQISSVRASLAQASSVQISSMLTSSQHASSAQTSSLHASSAQASPVQKAALPSLTAQQAAASQIYTAYETFLSKGQLVRAVSYLKQHISEVSVNEATIMTLHLENSQNKLLPGFTARLSAQTVQTQISKLYKKGDTLASLAGRTTHTSLRSLLNETAAAGYKLATAEGMYYPVLDYERYSAYRPYVNPDIRAYIDIMAEESKQAPAKDAALSIGYQQLTARAVAQELFIKTYPHSNRTAQIHNLFDRYMLYTFYGLNNTPLFDYEDHTIRPNALKGYQAVLSYRDPASSAYLRELAAFLKVVRNNGGKLTKEVEQYRKEHFPMGD